MDPLNKWSHEDQATLADCSERRQNFLGKTLVLEWMVVQYGPGESTQAQR